MALRIMTVDDDATIRRIVYQYAQALDPDVVVMEATNGQECLDKCSEALPDVIILDINMPIMNGEECLRHLRGNQRTCTIPVVMVTTESEKQRVLRMLALGVQEYVIKPFGQEEFLEKVTSVLTQSQADGHAARPGGAVTPSGQYLLLIEDRQTIAEIVSDGVNGSFPVVFTGREDDALAHFRKRAPIAVFINLALSDFDPFYLLGQLQNTPKRSGVRYVGMCLKTAGKLIERARRIDGLKLLLKPFSPDRVRSVLPDTSEASITRERKGGVLVLRCRGAQPWEVSNKLYTEIDNAAEDGFLKIVVDLSQLPEKELAEPGLWLEIAHHTAALGMECTYVAPSTDLVGELSGFVDTRDLVIVTEEEVAIEKLAA